MYAKDEKDAIKIIYACAKEYKDNLENKNHLIIFRDIKTKKIQYVETVYYGYNFYHLTGLELMDKNNKESEVGKDGETESIAKKFYSKCLGKRMSPKEIRFKDDTTSLKLAALPQIVNIRKYSKIMGNYNNSRPKLELDIVMGNITCCLGYILNDDNFYSPASCLYCDVRTLIKTNCQVLAILEKEAKKSCSTYGNILYVAKGFDIYKLNLPDKLATKINLKP